MKKEILITPKDNAVIACGNSIQFPSYEKWVPLSTKHTKIDADHPDTLWNPGMGRQVNSWLAGNKVDLTQGHSLQTRWGPIILKLTETGPTPLLIDGHDNRHYSLPFLPWSADQATPLDALLKAITESLVIRIGQKIGFWSYGGNHWHSNLAQEYSNEFSVALDESLYVEVRLYQEIFEDAIIFCFGDECPFQGIPVFYPLEGAILGLVPFYIAFCPPDVKIISASRKWELHAANPYNRDTVTLEKIDFETKKIIEAFVLNTKPGE